MPFCLVALYVLAHSCEFLHSATVSTLFRVQGWWCNLVLFPAGSQTSEQADRKSRGSSDKPCENGVRTHSRCSQSHFTSGLFKARNEGCSLTLHIIMVKLSSQNTSSALKWAMLSEVTFCALRVCFCGAFMFQAVKALFLCKSFSFFLFFFGAKECTFICCLFLSKLLFLYLKFEHVYN